MKTQNISRVANDNKHTENGNMWSHLMKILNKSTLDRMQEISDIIFNSHIRDGDTCSFKIEDSIDNISQTTSPHLNGKPSTKDLKGKESRDRSIRVKDPRSEGSFI